jgi:hypothetical protein
VPDHYAKLTRAVVEIGTQLRRIADAHTTPVADDADDAQTTALLDLKETIRAQRHETAALVQQRERLRDTLHEVLCAFAVGAAYGEPATYTLAHPISKATYESWSHVVDHPGDGPGYNRSVHVSLATPCGACTHPYNWHGAGPCTFGNETNRCGCAGFTTDDARAEVEYHQQLSVEQGQALARAETAREEQRRRADQAEQRAAAMERAMESTAAAALKHSGCHAKLVAQCIRVEQAEERRDQLAATLAKVLSHFVHKGHPGEPCLQTGWIAEKTVAEWRAVLYPPATEEQPAAGCVPGPYDDCPNCLHDSEPWPDAPTTTKEQ